MALIPDSSDPQGIAVSPDGSTLHVTNPDAGTLWQVNAASGRVEGVVAAGAEPYSVTITPNGSSVRVDFGDLDGDQRRHRHD